MSPKALPKPWVRLPAVMDSPAALERLENPLEEVLSVLWKAMEEDGMVGEVGVVSKRWEADKPTLRSLLQSPAPVLVVLAGGLLELKPSRVVLV